MVIEWTASQKQRLREIGIAAATEQTFASVEEREEAFKTITSEHLAKHRKEIRQMLDYPERHPLPQIESLVAQALTDNGFIEVRTPSIISRSALEKMGIDRNHPLHEQVFWLDDKRCLRPMLAPNLYFMMRHMYRYSKGPLRLFEVGSCFRKESKGSNHLEEFTMLNLVEMAPANDPSEQLKLHIKTIMDAVGLDYELVECESDVYVKTLDVEVKGIEVASGAVGPHKLDPAHGITQSWAGVGFGLERLSMLKYGMDNIKKSGRSLIYLRGVRLDI
ncbi:pyrrolysine--tRNA(Pyl) ligase large subunit [Candidatus Methanomassiliicoccus intestinalis]|uniref:pyrrolysine--tRNA(Pyl) ligase large subunit n=1 Tax=Candidatus Methanomassiliicoccus intestinalis TaxID=1406512 RepID=UPI0037DCF2C1